MYFTIVRLMYSRSMKNSNKILKTSIIAFYFFMSGFVSELCHNVTCLAITVTTIQIFGSQTKNNDGSPNELRSFKLFLLMPTICNASGLHTEHFLAVETIVDV